MLFDDLCCVMDIFQIVHQHFGNQVTCEYWDYVWLNEGFASYLEYVIADMVKNRK